MFDSGWKIYLVILGISLAILGFLLYQIDEQKDLRYQESRRAAQELIDNSYSESEINGEPELNGASIAEDEPVVVEGIEDVNTGIEE